MAKLEEKKLDFLRTQPERKVEEGREVRMAENVLSSYTRAEDLLAEALQNAADAIDERSASDPDAPRRIEIVLDRQRRSFSVTDTGSGISTAELEVVLAPNVTYKSGQHSKNPNRRSRGEKGVGLSFLVFACNRFELETANGEVRQRAVVRDAYQWIESEGETKRPFEEVSVFNDLSAKLGSTRYTTVTVSEIAEETFDDDLFEMSEEELVWLLRTRTAIGDTSYVFEEIGRSRSRSIDVEFILVDEAGDVGKPITVKDEYALPQELLDQKLIVDWHEVADLSPAEQLDKLSGRALRYVHRERTKSGRMVDVYFLVVDGRQMANRLKKRKNEGKFAPSSSWQGLWLATRGMPANVTLKEDIITPRTYARRTFALLQYDELKLDLGRKTVAGRVRHMLNEVAEKAWGTIADAAERVQQGTEEGAGKKLLRQRLERARKAKSLGAGIPYLKVPTTSLGVSAIFHELIGADESPLPSMYTLRTGVFEDGDELVYAAKPNGVPPMLVLYGYTLKDIARRLQKDERLMETAELAVVWKVGRDPGVEVAVSETKGGGATHEMLLYKSIERLPVIVLESLFASSDGRRR
jgi:molecular chaperone HtpG